MRPTLDPSTAGKGAPPPIVRHRNRAVWGRAVMVWEAFGKRAFQFEDGALRIFADGFYHLLEEVELPDAEANRLVARLARQADREEAPAAETTTSSSTPERKGGGPTIETRVAWFKNRYPDGFAGEAWKKELRGYDGGRRKRHRDPLIAAAQEGFTPDAEPLALAQVLGDIAASTDLVAPRTGDTLLALPEEGRQALGEGLIELFRGELAFGIRFERWLDRLQGTAPSIATWAVATLPMALLEPTEHFFVRRTMTRRESQLRGLRLPTAAGTPAYESMLYMANGLRDELIANDCPPADLLDVHDFIRITLSPVAAKSMNDG